MTPMTITWVYEPRESPSFHLGRDHRFISEIGRHAGLRVPLIEGPLSDVAPREGFILLNSFHPSDALAACPVDQQAELASRVIPIDLSRSRIFARVLESLCVPAAVDYFSHMEWRDAPTDSIGARGPYGLRAIAELIGATCDEAEGGSERYGYLVSATHQGLPHLLADYLTALHQARQ